MKTNEIEIKRELIKKDIIMKKLLLLSVIIVTLTMGCAHTIAINSLIQPDAFIAKKFPYTVAVVFPNDMKAYIEHARPSSFSGSANTYNFEMGKQLCDAIFRAVQIAYENPVEPKTNPQQGEYDRIIKFGIVKSNIDVYFQSGYFSSTARANYAISITIETYDGKTMKLIRKSTVNGSGFSARDNSDVFYAEKQFAKAIEDGVKQVCDNIASLLISGFAEPKVEK
jgi:hypothetical protein